MTWPARRLERPPAGEPAGAVVPVADRALVAQPAQVDLLALPQRREVDQPAVEVADDDVEALEHLQHERDLERCRSSLATGPPAARFDTGDRVALLEVGLLHARDQLAEAIDLRADVPQRRVGLLQRPVVVVLM